MRHTLISLIIISLFGFNGASGQNLTDVKGEIIRTIKYADLEGSPFYSASWIKGNVEFADGKVLNDINLKYDQVKDALLFKGKDGEELYFIDAVKKFSLNEMVFRNGFLPYKRFTKQSFYEIVSNGEISLLKKNVKSISEYRAYNSANVSQRINENRNIFIGRENKIIASQNDDIKTIANAIDFNKSSFIIDFSNKNKLNLKKEEDLIRLVNYYNSLNN